LDNYFVAFCSGNGFPARHHFFHALRVKGQDVATHIGVGQVGADQSAVFERHVVFVEAVHHPRRGVGPFEQQVVDQCLLARAGVGASKLGQLGLQVQRLRGAQAHGRAQIAHQTAALQVRQRLRCTGKRRVVGEGAVKVVVGQQQAAGQLGGACAAHCAAHAGEVAAEGLGVAPAQVHIVGRARYVDAGHAQLGKGREFVALADAVLVGIFPELHTAKGCVACVKPAIRIAVQIGQRFKAVGGDLPCVCALGEHRAVAKQLAPGVDGAIAIEVAHHQAIAPRQSSLWL
jgi:hypothetical protein